MYKNYYNLRFEDNGYFLSCTRKEKAIKELIDRTNALQLLLQKQ